MIVKSLTYKNKRAFKTVVNYILKEVENKESPFLITRYVKEKNAEAISRQLLLNEQLRNIKRKGNVLLNMDILSFHKNSSSELNETILKDLTRKYISLKCPKSISCASVHYSTNSVHVHLVYGIEYRTGKAVRVSKQNFSEIKQSLETYQRLKYPQLVHSEINHVVSGKAKISTKEDAMEYNRGVLSTKKQIIQHLEQAYLKSESKQEFYDFTEVMGYELYRRNDKITGLIHNKRKYRYKTLGFWEQYLSDLDKSTTKNKRLEALKKIRERQAQQKGKER